jgi:broad specificity phosphatase PhoE
MRARETAAHVGGVDALWKVDDRLKERDWGIYGATPFEDRAGLFASTERLRGLSSLYTRLDGGESLGDNVLVRIRDWLGTLHRDAEGQSALAVAHGELIWTARYIIERMLPEEWDEVEEDKSQKIRNCSITWYSRVNPTDPEEISKHIKWRKMIYPDNESQSPFGGEWVELPGKRYFSGEMLLESVEKVTPLLEQPN